jgi:hypothetical protein
VIEVTHLHKSNFHELHYNRYDNLIWLHVRLL